MATQNEQGKRLLSLDALRGFDMLFIMGFSGLIRAICALFPNGKDCYLAQTMTHVKWDGLYHHDTIFPLFLFTFISPGQKRLGIHGTQTKAVRPCPITIRHKVIIR